MYSCTHWCSRGRRLNQLLSTPSHSTSDQPMFTSTQPTLRCATIYLPLERRVVKTSTQTVQWSLFNHRRHMLITTSESFARLDWLRRPIDDGVGLTENSCSPVRKQWPGVARTRRECCSECAQARRESGREWEIGKYLRRTSERESKWMPKEVLLNELRSSTD